MVRVFGGPINNLIGQIPWGFQIMDDKHILSDFHINKYSLLVSSLFPVCAFKFVNFLGYKN